jgi:hypothetical protein
VVERLNICLSCSTKHGVAKALRAAKAPQGEGIHKNDWRVSGLPKIARQQHFFQQSTIIGHHPVNAHIEQPVHGRFVVNRPNMNLQAVPMRIGH